MMLSHPRPDHVVRTFGLGKVQKSWQRVPGGLSNRIWRLDTDEGSFAIKQMVAGTQNPGFERNVNAGYAIETTAIAHGVSAPRPVPPLSGAGCLAPFSCVDGEECLVRVHEWVDGSPVHHRTVSPDQGRQLGEMLASIHTLTGLPESDSRRLAAIGGVFQWELSAIRADEDGRPWARKCHALLPVLERLESRVQLPESSLTISRGSNRRWTVADLMVEGIELIVPGLPSCGLKRLAVLLHARGDHRAVSV